MKYVWVVGASSGIGKATALAFAKEGNQVLISSRNLAQLEEVQQQFPLLITCLPLDITQSASRLHALEVAKKWAPHIDILVHSAGVSQRASASDTRLEVVQQVFDVNFFGLIELNRLALPLLKKSSTIVLISSLVAKFGTPYRSAYSASKHALDGYFESLRYELLPKEISICMIYAGYVQTNLSHNALTADGSLYHSLDETQKNGLSAETCAQHIIKAISQRKSEVLIGKSERFAVYLKRFLPRLFFKIIRSKSFTH